jgi:glyoxylase-like metal-dependent hydrolase (beta-lactamase superfamily II)
MEQTRTQRLIFEDLFSFRPNRHTLGGTAYLLVHSSQNCLAHNWLVDTPLWSEENRDRIEAAGGIGAIFLTHRGAIGEVEKFVLHFGCPVHIQEQEAYLVSARGAVVIPFAQDSALAPGLAAIWTPGYSPGSSCLLWDAHGGILFSGRHLLPDGRGRAVPLRTPRTFHWPRQLASAETLRRYSYQCVCPGAATGLLRAQPYIAVEPA